MLIFFFDTTYHNFVLHIPDASFISIATDPPIPKLLVHNKNFAPHLNNLNFVQDSVKFISVLTHNS